MSSDVEELINELSFEDGLISAIVQDAETDKVLMLAYMNKKAFKKTIKEKMGYFYSRSREKLWKKGETSGNVQKVKEIYIDCDGDAILVKVDQENGACHTGHESCFYRRLIDNSFRKVEDRVFDPEDVYGEDK
ncbi:MAG: Phosphoribosyl-AMP cyclohydrolase [Candidatus Methanohalarchaeum thermophilum]|uniref:Phosphoribosyl-AMP cyclohydrolase n=1 Tax=Methanohalarchaeum thermophilum TaxID=1903181 RepID=A0A1Q6DVR7_METT1|nr:MAG: Phosphoribosyl-AMP cyclohydrolase [Candidatus Methanohalarchaeum thermophilum]